MTFDIDVGKFYHPAIKKVQKIRKSLHEGETISLNISEWLVTGRYTATIKSVTAGRIVELTV